MSEIHFFLRFLVQKAGNPVSRQQRLGCIKLHEAFSSCLMENYYVVVKYVAILSYTYAIERPRSHADLQITVAYYRKWEPQNFMSH